LKLLRMNLTINSSAVKLDDRHAKMRSLGWVMESIRLDSGYPLCAPLKSEEGNSHV
jgi:hypothetical protein